MYYVNKCCFIFSFYYGQIFCSWKEGKFDCKGTMYDFGAAKTAG